MNTNTIITIALSVYFFISGIIMLVKGKMLRGDYSKYTEKSVKAFARVMGACFTISGLLFVPYWVIGYMNGDMKKITPERGIILLVILGVVIISLILRFVILKKPSSGKTQSFDKSVDEDDI